MKKVLLLILALVLLVSPVYAKSENQLSIYLDQEQLLFRDIKPMIKDGRAMIPLRSFLEKTDFQVFYNPATKTVYIIKGNINITFSINSKIYYKNGQKFKFDVVPQVINGKLMVPLKFLSEALGYRIEWNGQNYNVIIKDPAKNPEKDKERDKIRDWKPKKTAQTLDEFIDYNKMTESAVIGQVNGKKYLLVSMGEQKTGGYSVKLSKQSSLYNKYWTFDVQFIEPEPGEFVTQALTYPNLLLDVTRLNAQDIKVRIFDKNDKFIKQLEVQ